MGAAFHSRISRHTLGALFSCWFAAGTAFGQSSPPASTDIWTQATLTGDWGGLRPHLESKGIVFRFEYIGELLSNLRGGVRRGEVFDGHFHPQVDVDLEKLIGWSGGRARLSGMITHGPDFSPHYIGHVFSASNVEVPRPVMRLFEAWYEQNAFNDRLSLRAGLMLADTEFMASDVAFTFMNSTLGWQAWLANDLPFGGPAYPLSTPGARVRVKPVDDAYVQAAIFSGDSTGGDGSTLGGPFPQGTVFSFRGGAFLLGEIGYTPNQGKGAKGLPGNYKLGAWYHTGSRFADHRFDHTGLSLADPLTSGIPLEHTGNWGIYGVLEQMLYRVPGTDDQGLSAFLRIGGAPNDRNLISFYFDSGLVYKGLIPGRPDDKLGVAVAYARIGNNARAFDRDVGFFTSAFYPVRIAEGLIELSYQFKVAPWWTIQPDLQYIIRPAGGVLNDDGSFRQNVWVAGLRSIVNF